MMRPRSCCRICGSTRCDANRAEEIRFELLAQVRKLDFLDHCPDGDARVVDQDFDGTGAPLNFGYCVVYRAVVADIHGEHFERKLFFARQLVERRDRSALRPPAKTW